jgi:hypothetical protein
MAREPPLRSVVGASFVLLIVMTTFLAPIMEEWLFRGVLFRALSEGGPRDGSRAGRGGRRGERGALRLGPRRAVAVRRPVLSRPRAGDAGVAHQAPRAEHRDAHVLSTASPSPRSSINDRCIDARVVRSSQHAGNRLDALVISRSSSSRSVELHPSLIFSNSTITGGDTGSHLAVPAYLKSVKAIPST